MKNLKLTAGRRIVVESAALVGYILLVAFLMPGIRALPPLRLITVFVVGVFILALLAGILLAESWYGISKLILGRRSQIPEWPSEDLLTDHAAPPTDPEPWSENDPYDEDWLDPFGHTVGKYS